MIDINNITTVDIWSNLYTTCLEGYLDRVGVIEGKTVFKSFRGHYYFLIDSRYGSDFYL